MPQEQAKKTGNKATQKQKQVTKATQTAAEQATKNKTYHDDNSGATNTVNFCFPGKVSS